MFPSIYQLSYRGVFLAEIVDDPLLKNEKLHQVKKKFQNLKKKRVKITPITEADAADVNLRERIKDYLQGEQPNQ